MLARLAVAYARRRPLSTLLVVLLLALGTAVIAATLIVAEELESRLTRDAEGVDLVVGAKGSPLQLVLAGVYHVDVPPGNIPLATVATLRGSRLVAEAIPLALGDSVRGYRIVGTEPGLVAHYGARFAQGGPWNAPLEAVLGSEVARATGLGVGATFTGSHGLAEGGGEHGEHYRVSGVLAPAGSVVDRLVLTSLESVWDVHAAHHPAPATGVAPGPDAGTADARERPVGHAHASEDPDDHDHDARDANDAREVTMVLVRYASPVAAAGLPRAINETTGLVAASPALETARLLTVFGVGLDVLRGFALLLVAASALMLFVALVQALDERRYDIAILRTLGAHRWQVAAVLVAEATMLAATGAAVGIALAHAAIALAARTVPALASVEGAAWRFSSAEGWVVLGTIGVGILAAMWPSWRAARLDVAATLADS